MKEQPTNHYAEVLEQRFSSGILQELQVYPHFVTWVKTLENKKLPLNPHTGRAASIIDPETWGTLDQALFALKQGKGIGIGFVFAEDDPFTGIDIDKCIQNNQLTQEARDLVSQFDSYTELSQSHTGLHILVQGAVPEGRRKGNIEVYTVGRYFVVTTNHLKTAPYAIEERQSQLTALYASLSENKDRREAFPVQEHQIYVSDQAVLKKAENAKNGHRFIALFTGNIAGFPSKSEADFELILRLLYWTNDDVAQVRRLFLQSRLVDEKTLRATNGTTYLDETIANTLKKRRR